MSQYSPEGSTVITDDGGSSTTDQAENQVKDQVKEKAQVAQDKARGALGQARGRLSGQVDQRSTQAGGQVQLAAQDVRKVAEQLRGQGKDTPARVAEALTVNASDINDSRATFSNWGTCTDLFAPGVNITSAWSTGDTATNTISGTSMASPHVAGAAALYLQRSPSASPATVKSWLTNNATTGRVSGENGTVDRLLYSR